jgi:hypothetical protein
MRCSRLRVYGSRASASRPGALTIFPVGSARRCERSLTSGGAVGGGAAGRPGSEIAGRGRLASCINRRTNVTNAAWCSFRVAELMQRKNSEAEATGLDIFGPPDVGKERSQVPRIFFAPALRRGFSLAA